MPRIRSGSALYWKRKCVVSVKFLCGYTAWYWSYILTFTGKRDGLSKVLDNYNTTVVSKEFLLFTEGVYEVKVDDSDFEYHLLIIAPFRCIGMRTRINSKMFSILFGTIN
jgi:hypothetical protein